MWGVNVENAPSSALALWAEELLIVPQQDRTCGFDFQSTCDFKKICSSSRIFYSFSNRHTAEFNRTKEIKNTSLEANWIAFLLKPLT